jgi:polyhydroxyalkanoate synthesis regulator phasin
MKNKRRLIFGAAALLAAAGGGAAVAASGSSPSEENKAILDSAAKKLGISSSKLSAALKQALSDRVDAAVAAGRLTKDQGDVLKQRINSHDFPLFGGRHERGFGHGGFIGKLDAAAAYLGLTEAQLRTQLESGKSLAQVAQAQGKSASGLVDALVAAAKKRLDEAVAAGRLTKAQAEEMLAGLRTRITSIVNSTGPAGRPHFGFRHSGFDHSGRPPA